LIQPEQCRASRALLNWSQDELERRSGVAKKTIADFERGARSLQDRTAKALQETLEASGIDLIPQNGGGAGARLRLASPRLFRRDDVPAKEWVAFAFDYKHRRTVGFVRYAALRSNAAPIDAFDLDQQRILVVAADMVDRGALRGDGTVLIESPDLPPVGLAKSGNAQ
jgi:transcriptional regulator with XRE-family HTH domain